MSLCHSRPLSALMNGLSPDASDPAEPLNPPPPPIDCARMPPASPPRVAIGDWELTVTDSPSPPPAPCVPIVIDRPGLRFEVLPSGLKLWATLNDPAWDVPPPPPIDCATMPRAEEPK